MTWYTASVIIAIQALDGVQDRVPVFEDFYLIDAASDEEAFRAAEAIGRQDETLDDGLRLDDKPAKRVFLGIRKMRSVYNPDPLDLDTDRPTHGTELTHSLYEVDDLDIARRLARGEAVQVRYIDRVR